MPFMEPQVRWPVLVAALCLIVGPVPARAQGPTPAGAAVPAIRAEDLTPEERAEREARKDCKVRICAAFHNRRPDGGDISCNVIKTWRKEQLSKMMQKAKVSWPWGRVRCTADVKLKREMLVKALAEEKLVAALAAHHVVCEIERDNAEKSEIKLSFTPKVTFERGRAVKATLGWGRIEAPTLVKGAMWTATATDNTFNVLQGTVVDDINDFIGPRCDEVKADWAGK